MKIIVVEPLTAPYTKEIDGSLESMQEIVKGLIEPIYIDNNLTIIVNEEGKLRNLTPNRMIYNNYFQDVIHGTFFICLAPEESDTFQSLPSDYLQTLISKFSYLHVRL